MNTTDHSDTPVVTSVEQVNDVFNSLELSRAINSEEFRRFLDHIGIAIVISKFIRGDQRICYVNKAFEKLTGRTLDEVCGRGWSVLASFQDSGDPNVSLHQAMLKGDNDFLGAFHSTES